MVKLLNFSGRGKHVFRQIRNSLKSEGMVYLKLLISIITYYPAIFVKSKKFSFNGKRYPYFYDPYNHTWLNERSIEVPIILNEMKKCKGKILEVGNVLAHYEKLDHDVLDKYEKSEGVINEDAVSFTTNKKYDLIASISTVEHIGWDEPEKSSDKIPRTIENLKKCLNEKGKIIATVPMGYNPHLDKLIDEGMIKHIYFLKRKFPNRWCQVSYRKVKGEKMIEGVTAKAIAILVFPK
tara:strand:- start:6532 stop:7242 length:711 start_codon:yes stop_codon:yes gene_type:complete